MMIGIVLLAISPLYLIIHLIAQARAKRKQEEAEAAERRARWEKEAAKQEAQRAAAEQRQREQAARKAAAEKKQAEKEQKRSEAHALKLARAQELAELAERRLKAERELAELRSGRHEIISKPVADPVEAVEPSGVSLDQFAASIAPHPFPVACMLAKKYADNLHALDGKSFTITEKLDGVRCIARVNHASVDLYARSGGRIFGLSEIEKALAALDISAVLDGELLISGRGALPSKEEYKQTCAIVRSQGHKTGIVYHVFDMIPLDKYESQSVSEPYSARRAKLDQLKPASPVEVVPVLYSGRDTSMIENHLQAQRAARHEGIMLNINDAPYSFSRTSALLKYKLMNDCDLQIVAVNPGTGRFSDTLGSLSVAYKGGIVRVGSGIPDALRAAIWDNPAAYIGRVVTVQYFEETQDKTGKKSLRFPSFKELRDINKTVSYA